MRAERIALAGAAVVGSAVAVNAWLAGAQRRARRRLLDAALAAPAQAAAPSPPSHATRDELYAEAKRLRIRGRSQMTKAELEQAVGRSREATPA